jgi:CheY-like chemotaxis protein
MNHDTTSAQKKILIVDDSEDMRLLLEQILEEEDYALRFAENGQQSMKLAVEFQPDLILMDMSLPGMSGWEVVPLLRTRPEFAHTPIIAVTAHVSKEDQERALAVGCDTHLGKPFDIITVLETINRLLN